MTDIPQPVNLYHQQAPPSSSSRDHGLRINAQVKAQEPVGDEVSPLTPQASDQHKTLQDERSVSPIEPAMRAIPHQSLSARPLQSQIPRKAVKPIENNARAQTKWDEYSGEPTTDGRGKAASVRPGTQPVEMQYPHLKERTKQILAGLRERDAAKNLQWGRAPPPVTNDPLDQPIQREPWKGASGRAAIVEPVKNTPSARRGPLSVAKRVEIPSSAPETYHEHTTPTNLSSRGPQLPPVASEEDIVPVAPLRVGKRIRTPELVTKTDAVNTQAQSSYESPALSPEPLFTYHESSPEIAHYRVESPLHDEEPKTPDTPVTVETPRIANKPESLPAYEPPNIDREQSRFSWTTYTTSAAESPRSLAQTMRGSSPPLPIPDSPPAIPIRKRPVSSSPFMHSSPYVDRSYADSTSSVVRKPVPGFNPRSSSLPSAASRVVSTSKSLPPTPTILEASDKIENFHAQLEALERRKRNINRIISDLEASLKKNAIVYDMWKRKEVEKNITNHRLQLDDIGREIHDINFTLHRAQRKRDREDGYEACTGLWIKRVTS